MLHKHINNKNGRFDLPFLLNRRRLRDSNPRYPLEVYTLSRRAPSTTRTSLLTKGCKFTVCYGSLNKFLAFSVVNSAIISKGKLQINESFSATILM